MLRSFSVKHGTFDQYHLCFLSKAPTERENSMFCWVALSTSLASAWDLMIRLSYINHKSGNPNTTKQNEMIILIALWKKTPRETKTGHEECA